MNERTRPASPPVDGWRSSAGYDVVGLLMDLWDDGLGDAPSPTDRA